MHEIIVCKYLLHHTWYLSNIIFNCRNLLWDFWHPSIRVNYVNGIRVWLTVHWNHRVHLEIISIRYNTCYLIITSHLICGSLSMCTMLLSRPCVIAFITEGCCAVQKGNFSRFSCDTSLSILWIIAWCLYTYRNTKSFKFICRLWKFYHLKAS